MTGFFSRIFGGKKQEGAAGRGAADRASATGPLTDVDRLVEDTLAGIIERAQFDLEFVTTAGEDDKGERQLVIEFSGEDSELLKEKEGQMIDALQLYLKRVAQHRFPDDRTNILIDCEGYRDESNQALVELAEKLKGIALERNKAVYLRALPPKDRKVIHQHLANDDRVKSRSIGDGLFKKIKIFPIKEGGNQSAAEDANAEVTE